MKNIFYILQFIFKCAFEFNEKLCNKLQCFDVIVWLKHKTESVKSKHISHNFKVLTIKYRYILPFL